MGASTNLCNIYKKHEKRIITYASQTLTSIGILNTKGQNGHLQNWILEPLCGTSACVPTYLVPPKCSFKLRTASQNINYQLFLGSIGLGTSLLHSYVLDIFTLKKGSTLVRNSKSKLYRYVLYVTFTDHSNIYILYLL